jgi:biopolymer transport protein ExbD
MAQEPNSKSDGPPPHESAVKHSRFKESPQTGVPADSLLIDGSELRQAYHHVEEISADQEMLVARKFNRDDNEIDMTPMVDTTFLLLLFFMITAAFSLQRSLPVPTPRPETPSATVRVVTADVDVEAPSSHELLIRLREACEGNRAGRKPTKLLVMANIEALHDRVVAAMDAGSQVGMEEVQLMMVEENK